METYLTEMDAKRQYLVKVVLSDGKVCASGNFPSLGLAHEWIDTRRKRNVIHPEIARAVERERAIDGLRW
jgi:hypothetical protein